jgi:Tol biopolymer transport system component
VGQLVLRAKRPAILFGALLIALFGAAIVALMLGRETEGDSRTGPEFAVPRASGTLAFVRGMEGVVSDIYVARADGSRRQQLTHGPGFRYDPDWSPDGQWLLYRYEPPGPTASKPSPLGLVVMRADGSGAVDVARRAGVYSGPASWSPSGDRIAFSGGRPGDPSAIFVVRRDGSQLTRLTPPGREAQYPAWSPDGRKIAFTYVEGGFSIYVMDATGENVKRLTNGPQDNWPVWSPDSKRIAFSRGEQSIWSMNPDGTDARLVTRRGGAPLNWSPAENLVFSCPRPGGIGSCSISESGTGFRTLLDGAEGGFPAWRPGR